LCSAAVRVETAALDGKAAKVQQPRTMSWMQDDDANSRAVLRPGEGATNGAKDFSEFLEEPSGWLRIYG